MICFRQVIKDANQKDENKVSGKKNKKGQERPTILRYWATDTDKKNEVLKYKLVPYMKQLRIKSFATLYKRADAMMTEVARQLNLPAKRQNPGLSA